MLLISLFLGLHRLKIMVVGVPCFLFPLVLLVLLEKQLGEVFLDLTSGDVRMVAVMS